MKLLSNIKSIYCLVALLCFFASNAQAENPGVAPAQLTLKEAPQQEPGNDSPVSYAYLDVKPEYPGGLKKFYEYVNHNFTSPQVSQDMDARILISFVIERSGTIADVKVLRDPGFGMGAEAMRVIKQCPEKWTPGYQGSNAVRVNYILPITLKIKAEETETPPQEIQKQ
jgi:hypothetical protein